MLLRGLPTPDRCSRSYRRFDDIYPLLSHYQVKEEKENTKSTFLKKYKLCISKYKLLIEKYKH